MRHRIGRRAVDLPGQGEDREQVDQAEHQHDQKWHAAQNRAGIEHELLAQLRKVLAQAVTKGHFWRRGDACC